MKYTLRFFFSEIFLEVKVFNWVMFHPLFGSFLKSIQLLQFCILNSSSTPKTIYTPAYARNNNSRCKTKHYFLQATQTL